MHHKCLFYTDVGRHCFFQRVERAFTRFLEALMLQLAVVERSKAKAASLWKNIMNLWKMMSARLTSLYSQRRRANTNTPGSFDRSSSFPPVHAVCLHPSAVSMTPTAVSCSCSIGWRLCLKDVLFNYTLCFVTIFSPSGLVGKLSEWTISRLNHLKQALMCLSICWFITVLLITFLRFL